MGLREVFLGKGDDNRGEVAYVDPSAILGRTRYRGLASGKLLDEKDVRQVVEVDSPPLSAYLSFRGRN